MYTLNVSWFSTHCLLSPYIDSLHKKVRQPQLSHPKTQTSIVAKQTDKTKSFFNVFKNLCCGICIFAKSINTDLSTQKKAYGYSRKKNTPLSVFIQFVWHLYFITNMRSCQQFTEKKKYRPIFYLQSVFYVI